MKSFLTIAAFGFLLISCSSNNTKPESSTDNNSTTKVDMVAPTSVMEKDDFLTESDKRMLGYMKVTKEQIIESALKQSELIDMDGVLGGTMRIVKVQLINYKWAYATFEDGHIQGHLLLNYTSKDGKITWSVIQKDTKN